MAYLNGRIMMDEYTGDEEYSSLTFYHGTSDELAIDRLCPAAETGKLREEWRKKLTDKVFITDSMYSAARYAKKASKKYGGHPVVYIVRPEGDVWYTHTNEYVCDSAEIIGTANFAGGLTTKQGTVFCLDKEQDREPSSVLLRFRKCGLMFCNKPIFPCVLLK